VKRAILENRSQIYDGDKLFEAHEQQAARAREFTLMMHGHSIAPALTWPDNVDLSETRHMVDIGGGSGAHAIGAALRWPQLSATVLEIPTVCGVAREMIDRYHLQDRINVVEGDFWTEPLPSGDLHFYGDVFHDWPDEKCRKLATKSFQALEPGGRIMIHEVLYNDDKTGPFVAAALTVVMLAWTEGVQRSRAELGEILEAAGFGDVVVTPSLGYWSIVNATKPGG
ncbi:MAG: methyltransferase, partial [Pseudomonadota bacterium]